jgi:cation:H+ antiporter
MALLDFGAHPLWLNLVVFGVAAAIVWLVGTRLATYADAIAERTGLGKAFIGLVLLATATSLPEIGTTATASIAGNAALAVNNIFGGIAMQTAILAIADVAVVRGALTYFTPRPALLLEGASLVLLLALALAGIAAGPLLTLAGVGIWSALIFVTYLGSVYLLHQYEGQGRWKPVDVPPAVETPGGAALGERERVQQQTTRELMVRFAVGGGALLAAGWTVAQVADALAGQTGLGASFVGATLVAISTSLPEVSTTIAAARLGSYSMAVSNIFGSNALLLALLFLADLLYRPGPILQAVDRSATFAAAAGIVVTSVYLIGLIERLDRVLWRMGIDSVVVLVLYLGSLVVLYLLR